jgi:hypothetical protein
MQNLGLSYFALGRHHDALVLREKTLEFFRRVLPENHQQIGISCLNLGVSYCESGNVHRAMERAREALRILQATLPPSHIRVQTAKQLIRQIESDSTRRESRR